MKLTPHRMIFSWLLVFAGSACASAQGFQGIRGADGGSQTTSGDRVTYTYTVTGGVVTLYPRDAIAASLCFNDGKDGLVIQQGEVRNRCSHLRIEERHREAFGSDEQISIGVQGGQLGTLLDLGEESQLTQKYGYTDLPGIAFTSIQLSDGNVKILKSRQRREFQELKEAMPLLQAEAAQMRSSVSLPISVGHIYLGRILDRNDKNFDLWVKILVLAYVPGQTVTFRWQLL